MRQILPCPYCKHTPEECDSATYTGVSSYKGDVYFVQCDHIDCDINPTTGEFNSEQKAIEAWSYLVARR